MLNYDDIDVRAELEQFEWHRARWTDTKLIAASPFRYDRTPSFFVNLTGPYAGTWKDSGAYDAEWSSGGLVKLLAFLRNETEEETRQYLELMYGTTPTEQLTLKPPSFRLKTPPNYPTTDLLHNLRLGSSYLKRRGIASNVIETFGCREGDRYTAIPWRTPSGRLANVKYRSHYGKLFWYAPNAVPIRQLVWGMDVVNRHRHTTAVLCEAEIDAMSWWTAGIAAVAVGGVALSDEQVDVLKRSAIETLIIGVDNDKAGNRLAEVVARALSGFMRIVRVDYGGAKDANEFLATRGKDELYALLSSSIRTTFSIGTFK
jgi:hypothetical protein